MITLYGFGPAFGLLDPSPFVAKVHVLLRMAGLSYSFKQADIRKAPRGKIPFIVDDGLTVPDSTFIRWHIEQKYGVDFDVGLDARERATAFALAKLLEEHLYFYNIHDRWMNDDNFAKGPAVFFDKVPALMRPLVTRLVRNKLTRTLHGQGAGRFSSEEKLRLVEADLAAVANVMGERAFLTGAHPCGADATAFAFLSSVAAPHFDGAYRQALLKQANLVAYLERMHARFLAA